MANFYSKQPSSRISATTALTLSAGSQSTSNFGVQTYQVRIAVGAQPAFVKIGDGAISASTSDALIGANTTEYFTCSPGQKCAVLQAGTGGTITISEMA